MRFNTDTLASIAAQAVKAEQCISFEKIAEGRAYQPLRALVAYQCTGSSNRVFLLHFNNRSEAIARIPLPVIGNTHPSGKVTITFTYGAFLVLFLILQW